MKNKVLSRSYLESLTSAELMDIADEYGADIPADLNRRFLIEELIEISREFEYLENDLSGVPYMQEQNVLPLSYNETQITAIVRNPAWAYVLWDIRKADIKAANAAAQMSMLYIRALRFENEESACACEFFDLPVSADDRERYVLIPPGANVIRFDLIAGSKNNCRTLAVSQRIVFPKRLPDIGFQAQGKSISPILALSGLPDLLKAQYEEYRQSFS